MSILNRVFKGFDWLALLRWPGLWVSVLVGWHVNRLLLVNLTKKSLISAASAFFSASTGLLAVEVAGMAVIISLFSQKVMERIGPRKGEPSNMLVRLALPYLLAATSWVVAIIVFGTATLLDASDSSILAVRFLVAAGIAFFLYSLLSTVSLLIVVVDILDGVSRYVAGAGRPENKDTPLPS